MGSGAMIYIPSFMKFRHSKVTSGGFIDKETEWRSHRPAL
jgi:hypothetical protein